MGSNNGESKVMWGNELWLGFNVFYLEDPLMMGYGWMRTVTTKVDNQEHVIITRNKNVLENVRRRLTVPPIHTGNYYRGEIKHLFILYHPEKKKCFVPNTSRAGVQALKLCSGREILRLIRDKQLKWK